MVVFSIVFRHLLLRMVVPTLFVQNKLCFWLCLVVVFHCDQTASFGFSNIIAIKISSFCFLFLLFVFHCLQTSATSFGCSKMISWVWGFFLSFEFKPIPNRSFSTESRIFFAPYVPHSFATHVYVYGVTDTDCWHNMAALTEVSRLSDVDFY